MIDRFLTIGKVAEILGVSKWSVYSYARQGYFNVVKLPNGRKRVALSDLQVFIKSLKKKGTIESKSESKKSTKRVKRHGEDDDLDWTMDFVAKYKRFPNSEELSQRKMIGKEG